jgi:hypothetical protein
MSKEIYALKEPVEMGKIIITELTIDRRVKARYHRVISKPVPTEVQDGGTKMVMQLNIDGELFDLMEAMTGQPRQVIDELGLDDYLYLRSAAEEMRANFPNSLLPSK